LGKPLTIGDLVGTSEGSFSLGKDGHGIKKVDGETALFDPLDGEAKLTEMLGWRLVPSGVTRKIRGGYTHAVDEIEIADDGELYQEDDGHYILM